jgi:hypothetical protein
MSDCLSGWNRFADQAVASEDQSDDVAFHVLVDPGERPRSNRALGVGRRRWFRRVRGCRRLGDGMVRVRASIGEIGGRLIEGPPKSAAGRRDVAIPEAIVPELRAHLDEWSEEGQDGRVFVGPQGATPKRGNFQVTWSKAVEKAGVPGLHFHDLRHTGNTLAAEGASLRELMARMGHNSARAALIYQHASKDRERAIGAAISSRIEAVRAQAKDTIGTRTPETTGSRGRRKASGGRPDQGRRRGERVTGIEPA